MTQDSSQNINSLRDQAERLVRQRPGDTSELSPDEVRRLFHELQVHQIELEIQNEELRLTMDQLELSRQRFFTLFDQAPVGYLVLNDVGMIRQVNHTFCNMVNRTRETVLNHPISDLIETPEREVFLARFRAFFRNPVGKSLEARFLRHDGQELYARLQGASIADLEGSPSESSSVQLLLTASDITEVKRANKALQRSEERYRRLTENAQDIIYRYDLLPTPHFSYVSPASTEVTGYTPEEHYADSQLANKLIHPADQGLLADAIRADTNPRKSLVLRWVRKDGRVIWTEQRNVPILDETGRLVALEGIARDITERKLSEEALRESETRYRVLFESMQEGFALHEIVCDLQGMPVDYRFLDVNPAFEELTGLKREALIDKTVLEVLPGIEPSWIQRYGEVALTGRSQEFEDRAQEIGKYYNVRAFCPKLGQFAIIFSNVTERKRSEEALRASLQENKLLYRELQHRTKNSMAMIASLVSLETTNANDEAVLKALTNVRDRIRTLSELYRLLYLSGDSPVVRLDVYFTEIIESLKRAYGGRAGYANFTVDLVEVTAEEKTAAALGLILNELVTNALKYAFPDGQAGEIRVTLHSQGSRLIFQVEDNGVGMADSFDIARAEGIGMQLVSMLTSQVKGQLTYTLRAPTSFRIELPLPA